MAMPQIPMQGPPPGGAAGPPDMGALLGQMGGMPFPPFPGQMPGKGKKGNPEGKGKKGESKTPSAQLEKAADMIQNVITGLGPQSDLGNALNGLVQNLNKYVDQLSRPAMPTPGAGQPLQAPLGVGTPGQLPNESDMGGPAGSGLMGM
jgi:hypothetical protein